MGMRATALDSAQIAALTTRQVASLTSDQIASLSTEDLDALTTEARALRMAGRDWRAGELRLLVLAVTLGLLLAAALFIKRMSELTATTPLASGFDQLLKELPQPVLAYCRMHLPHHKCPKVVLFAQELPVTSTGKYQRNKVKHLFAAYQGMQFKK